VRSLSIAFVLFATGCSGALPVWEQPGLAGAVRPEMGGLQAGAVAPDFELPSDAGGAVKLSSLHGSWVVLHFTASWCPYCDSEVTHLGDIADAYAARGVKVVLVDEKEDEPRWRAYAATHVGKTVVSLRDADGAAALRYAPPRAQPSFADRSQVVLDSTLIIDPEGAVRLFLLPDSAHFDPTFRAVRRELDRMIDEEPVRLSVEGGTALTAHVSIAPGYHVQSHTPSEPQFIATRVEASIDGIALGEPRYPAGGTYENAFGVPFDVASNAGRRRAVVTVSYQACTRTRCLFPTKRRVETFVSLGQP
jgi:peroxiredoxin